MLLLILTSFFQFSPVVTQPQPITVILFSGESLVAYPTAINGVYLELCRYKVDSAKGYPDK